MDIYAAEYDIKMDKKKNITDLKQTTSLHLKMEDADAVDKHELFKQRRDAIEVDGWEPYQEWFYDNEFRLGIINIVRRNDLTTLSGPGGR